MRTQIYEISSTRAAASKRIQSKSTGGFSFGFFYDYRTSPGQYQERGIEHGTFL
jgi:hypothetical protein